MTAVDRTDHRLQVSRIEEQSLLGAGADGADAVGVEVALVAVAVEPAVVVAKEGPAADARVVAGGAGAVVVVEDAVVVAVRIAGIAAAVAVRIGLVVGERRAGGAGVAHLVAVALVGVADQRTVVEQAGDRIDADPVAVRVGIALIAPAVAVEVVLPRIGSGRAGVDRIGDAVAVAVLAGVTDAVAVGVLLAGVVYGAAVVGSVELAVVVVIGIAGVALAVGVLLAGVMGHGAVVVRVVDAVVVDVPVGVVLHQVAVGVRGAESHGGIGVDDGAGVLGGEVVEPQPGVGAGQRHGGVAGIAEAGGRCQPGGEDVVKQTRGLGPPQCPQGHALVATAGDHQVGRLVGDAGVHVDEAAVVAASGERLAARHGARRQAADAAQVVRRRTVAGHRAGTRVGEVARRPGRVGGRAVGLGAGRQVFAHGPVPVVGQHAEDVGIAPR